MIPPDLIPILSAIKEGDKARARELLKSLLKVKPSAEAWYLASRVTETQAHEIACLKRALNFDPYHVEARRRLSQLEHPALPPEGHPAGTPPVIAPFHTTIPPDKKPIIPDDRPLKKAKPKRRERTPWFYVGVLGAVLLSLVSTYFVLSVFGSPILGEITGVLTGQRPVDEIDGVPIDQVQDAPEKVEPAIVRPLNRGAPVGDTLPAGIAHEYTFNAFVGEEIVLWVQFVAPGSVRVRRNVAIFDGSGVAVQERCEPVTIVDGPQNAAFVCRVESGGTWRIRLLGRQDESTGAYFINLDRFVD